MSDSTSPIPPAPASGVTLAPVPPIVEREKTPAQKSLEVRVWCSFVFVICAGMLAFGIYLKPDPFGTGTGTHQQLGLPPCGFLQVTGVPCPTCGCTTAVTQFAHGHVLKSLMTQPFGFVVALVATILVPLTLLGMVTGNWKGPSMFILGWHWRMWTYGSVGILLLAWVYKIIIVRMQLPM